jgi:hypothetical protein
MIQGRLRLEVGFRGCGKQSARRLPLGPATAEVEHLGQPKDDRLFDHSAAYDEP